MSFFKYLKRKFGITRYERIQKKYNIGKHSYINKHTEITPQTKIGKFCSIADYVCIGMGSHPLSLLSTHPFIYWRNDDLYGKVGSKPYKLLNLNEHRVSEKENNPVIIGNDVYIAYGAFIKKGIVVGDGAVIGAGSIVVKDVPPYAVVAGNPAKVIRYRFDENTIAKLLNLKWWDCPDDFITTLPFDDINKCISMLEDFWSKQ